MLEWYFSKSIYLTVLVWFSFLNALSIKISGIVIPPAKKLKNCLLDSCSTIFCSNVGAVTSFIGYVRDNNNNTNVQSINLEVYEKMAYRQFEKIIEETTPPAPNIKILLSLRLYFEYLIANSKPAASVLWPIIFPLFR